MSDAIASVIVASAQSVAKVFVIGSIGYGAVKFPRNAPLLPRSSVGTVARFTFHTFTLSLIYSTIAVAVRPSSLGNYWFLIVGGWVVLGTSYLVATILRYFFPINNKQDFVALRVATTFPNIVALPILIFPSLCEFPVVYEGYASDYANMTEETDGENITSATLRQECVAQSNTMIFCYFFAWSLAFWSFGYPQLMQAAKENRQNHQVDDMQVTAHDEVSRRTSSSSKEDSSPVETKGQDEEHFFDTESPNANHSDTSQQAKEQTGIIDEVDERNSSHVDQSETIVSTVSPSTKPRALESSTPERAITNEPLPVSWWTRIWLVLHPFWQAIKQTTTSPGFIAMVLAFVTACIPPLQRALFEPAGPLRFIGSAVEALGTASSPISTMVVAASLVPPQQIAEDNTDPDHRVDNDQNDGPTFDERPGMTDPNFGPYQRPTRRHRRSSRFQDFRRELRSSSIRILNAVPRSTPEMRRLHIWFSLSRLILAPAVVVGLILAFDCSSSTILNSVPNLAKLVIIVNASLPGALIIVVLLKAKEECAETAAAVSKVYLPSYLLSIFTIAGWCAVGLWITLPDKEGRTFCQQM
ncbi:membrane transport protein [Nitzschia inconspicua]|uniref:Membrane transport protein n=1 Tax=Nitzschia inconspicua TaxID=303405 RepID=A0A9K3PR95_9STRA|nr:membrane transport protein [Nitzschia inconspicua]